MGLHFIPLSLETLRVITLLVPVAITMLALYVAKPAPRRSGAALIAFLWNLTFILMFSAIGEKFGWWSFHPSAHSLLNVPVDLWLGWATLWGPMAFLLFRRFQLIYSVIFVVSLDMAVMPMFEPLVRLDPSWPVGEVVLVLFVFIPAQLFARWTDRDECLACRSLLHVVGYGCLAFWFLPTAILDMSGGYWSVPAITAWQVVPAMTLGAAILMFGVSAVLEFAVRGRGTPVPFDPPKRLVDSGPYAYVANPMQSTNVLVLAYLGLMLESLPIALAGVAVISLSVSAIRWHQQTHIAIDFGENWSIYRSEVRNWWPRWRPYVPATSRIHVRPGHWASDLLRRFLGARPVQGLEIVSDATNRSSCISYVSADAIYRAEGLEAVGRSLEHINFLWTLVGIGLRIVHVLLPLGRNRPFPGLGWLQ